MHEILENTFAFKPMVSMQGDTVIVNIGFRS